MGVLNEFKAFAVKGNVVDMAVGIIIGAAFGKIVSSFVGDVIMPPIGLLIGGVDFSDLAITLTSRSGRCTCGDARVRQVPPDRFGLRDRCFRDFHGCQSHQPSEARRSRGAYPAAGSDQRRGIAGRDPRFAQGSEQSALNQPHQKKRRLRGAVCLPVVFNRHLARPPSKAQAHVPLFEQCARVVDHLRIATQHDARVFSRHFHTGGSLNSPFSISVVIPRSARRVRLASDSPQCTATCGCAPPDNHAVPVSDQRLISPIHELP